MNGIDGGSGKNFSMKLEDTFDAQYTVCPNCLHVCYFATPCCVELSDVTNYSIRICRECKNFSLAALWKRDTKPDNIEKLSYERKIKI